MAPGIARTIVTVARGTSADLIVMSTQALTGAARALLGNVADAVVRGAHCPVLLLHRAEIDRETGRVRAPRGYHRFTFRDRFAYSKPTN